MMHRMSPPPEGYLPLPERLAPMMATLADALPADDDRWAYEMKWDGVRAVVHVDGGRPTAWSRNDIDITDTYPELRAMAESLGATQAVLDGELVALDPSGRPSFELLQPRMHVSGAARIRRLTVSVPVTYFIFDVLHLDGRSTLSTPYRERRALLEDLDLAGPSWRTPPAWFGGGHAVLAAAREQHLEGVVAKQAESPYQPGARAEKLAEDQEPPHPGGAHCRLAVRAGTAGRHHRCTAAGHPGRRRAALRRQGRHRVHRRHPSGPSAPTGTVGHEPFPLRRGRSTSGRPRRALGQAGARRRGPVHRVDP